MRTPAGRVSGVAGHWFFAAMLSTLMLFMLAGAETTPEASADPLYGAGGEPLSGGPAGHTMPAGGPDPAPPTPVVDTVEELTVASFHKHVSGSQLPWLVVYISCVLCLYQSRCLP